MLMWISSVQKGKRIDFYSRSEFQMFLLISGTQLWRFHTELSKFLQHILTANSSMKNRKDLRFGKVDKLLINKSRSLSRVLHYDKTRWSFENTSEM